MLRRSLIAVAVLTALSCGPLKSPTEPVQPRLAEGYWGGGACLRVDASAVSVSALCGTGSFSRPSLDPAGGFAVDGTFFGGGPPPLSPPPPARYSGRVDRDTIALTITIGTQTYGPFTATRNSPIQCPPPCP